jgi:putative endonuclease
MDLGNCVYILLCNDGTLYAGWTNDVAKRLRAHNEGKASKYTRGKLPARLVYVEQCETQSEAMRRECAIKKMKRARKLELIERWKA